MTQIITLITGADKGIGFETAKALSQKGQHVLLGSRSVEKGQAAINTLQNFGVTAELIQLDVTKHQSILEAAQTIRSEYGYLNILINNAGVVFDQHQKPSELPISSMRQEFDVNFFGLVDVTQVMLPLLKAAQWGKIINISSNMGSLGLASDATSQFYNVSSLGYQASKAAVNFATICFAKELADSSITVNSVNPGWTNTEFGGRPKDAPKIPGMQDVQTGAARIIALASDTNNDTTMTFTENDGSLPW